MKKGICKYFNGIQHEECEKGVNCRELVGGDVHGWVKRSPCFKKHKTVIVCNEMELPTNQEIKKFDEDFKAFVKKMTVAMEIVPRLKAKHPNGGNGQIECPACKGTLSYSIARTNKHIHMRCNTDGCISMME